MSKNVQPSLPQDELGVLAGGTNEWLVVAATQFHQTALHLIGEIGGTHVLEQLPINVVFSQRKRLPSLSGCTPAGKLQNDVQTGHADSTV